MKQNENILIIYGEAVRHTNIVLKDFPKTLIGDEERLQHMIQAFTRLILATAFFCLSVLFSIGMTVTSVIAQTISKDQPTKVKSASRHLKHYNSRKRSGKPNTLMSGTASWYGQSFHNRKTASGKRFDQDAFMAAHRSLPFGTLVRIINTVNHKSCIVEITDRGPFVKNRIIDVSRGAAQELGFANEGTAQVRLEIVSPTDFFVLRVNIHASQHPSDVLRTPSLAMRSTSVNY
jgi:rare lipoprotein A